MGSKDKSPTSNTSEDRSALKVDSDATDKEQKVDEEPKIGMMFDSEEKAYDFYNEYAGRTGFSIRRNQVKKSKTGVIQKRIFCCSKEGRRAEYREDFKVVNHRPISRTDCKAQMTIRLQPNGQYAITKLSVGHNHAVVSSAERHMLRSQKGLVEAPKAEVSISDKVNTGDNSDLTPKAVTEVMARQVEGPQNLGHLPVDHKNYLSSRRMRSMEKGDTGALLEYFQKKQVEDPFFYYAIQVDVNDQMTNIFWADGKSIMDYSHFGDVVCFDTTYRTHNYGRPFAPFIGVNHHKQIVVFAATLLYDETIESFKWVFDTFLSAMSGKHPKTILTDQCVAMSNAIALVLQGTNHRLCVWHIYQNTIKHLNQEKDFESDFRSCIHDHEEEQDFLKAWQNVLEKYNLTQNIWLQYLFEERKKWALVYERNTFCADMNSMQQSESITYALKTYLGEKHDLLQFFTHYERIMTYRRYQESLADFKMTQTTPVLCANVKMLKEAVKVYTPEIFQMFQKEYQRFLDCEIYWSGGFDTTSEYKVTFNDRGREHIVILDSSKVTVECTCKKFNFVGILCSHALKVLDYNNIKMIPTHYILQRWRRDAKADVAVDHHEAEIQGEPHEALGKRYGYLCRKLFKVATMSAENEETYTFANAYADKILEEVKLLLKGVMLKEPPIKSNNQADENVHVGSVHGNNGVIVVDGETSQNFRGIKRKKDVAHGRHGLENSLERGSRKRKDSGRARNEPSNALDVIPDATLISSYNPLIMQQSQLAQSSYVSGAHHLTPSTLSLPCTHEQTNIHMYQQGCLNMTHFLQESSIREHGNEEQTPRSHIS